MIFARAMAWIQLAAALWCFPAAADTARAVEIRADRLEVARAGEPAVFAGNVRVRLGDAALRCGRLVVVYDERGGLQRITASGGVRIRRGALTAGADTAAFDATRHQVTLSGNAWVERGGNRLWGASVVVDLRTESVVVESARGTWRLPEGPSDGAP